MKNNSKFPRASSPFTPNSRPELDTSPELNSEDTSYYQSLIGVLRWIVELGRIDIATEASTMASHMAMPRQGHLKLLHHMFGFLKMKHNAELLLDPSDPIIDTDQFVRED